MVRSAAEEVHHTFLRSRFPFSSAVQAVLLLVMPWWDASLKADWPVHRGNNQRTGFREQQLTSSAWQPAWICRDLDAPAPAWPAPAQGSLWQELRSIEARVVDDRGDVPLIASDSSGNLHVLVSSSSTDRLVSLDPVTGDVQWQCIADGPIRYAPQIQNGWAWFGSDDGMLRAIDLGTGEVRWSRQIGPDQPKILGNGRLIGSHPIRTSTIVSNDVVFATAGLFPSQGVYAAAFKTTDGSLVWRRQIKRSPQGYLLTDHRNRLCIPCGRSAPFCVASESGRFVCDLPSSGGSFCMLTRDVFFSGPGNTPSVQSYPYLPKAKMLPIDGRAIAAGQGLVWFSNGKQLKCHDLKKMTARQKDSEIWSVPCQLTETLIAAGSEDDNYVFVAGDSAVTVFDGQTGARLHELNIPSGDEAIRYLAVSDSANGVAPELIVATTNAGSVYAWHGTTAAPSDSSSTMWHVDKDRVHHAAKARIGPHGESRADRIQESLALLKSDVGWALVVNDLDGSCAKSLAMHTRLNVVSLVSTVADRDRLRERFVAEHFYGRRLTVLQHTAGGRVPFAEQIFNLVFEAAASEYSRRELLACVDPGSGVVGRAGERPFISDLLPGMGAWRHQYGSPANTSDSGDSIVGQATEFRLQWFGGVGPARMPDRHLRAQSPLAAGASLVLHGDASLIGVDPANGRERWELNLPPDAVRYVMPFDGGYSCLTPSGELLYTSVGRELWKLDAVSGERIASIPVPPEAQGLYWGYVAEQRGRIFASAMKPDAGRLKGPPHGPDKTVRKPFSASTLRERYTKQDYNSARPLVCSRILYALNANGSAEWKYAKQSVIANSSISLDDEGKRLVFIESRSESCVGSDSDRISAADLTVDSQVVCLSAESGEIIWTQPLPFPRAMNILYTLVFDDCVILATSESGEKKASYLLAALDLQDGSLLWTNQHTHVVEGLGHGEQVHHPLALRQPSGRGCLIAEPYLYDPASGERINPDGTLGDWVLRRPGHSCGTMSGAGQCVFFRAGNPAVLNLAATETDAFQKLSPTRPGCWINMLPAGGRLLIPEGSASCVCSFPVQTSLGFVPVTPDRPPVEWLEEFPSLAEERVQELYAWNFEPASVQEQQILPVTGALAMQATHPIEMSDSGLVMDGRQWLAVSPDNPDLPSMPATLSLEACLRVSEGNSDWTAIVGAVQDNGDFERGALLGIHQQRFFFAIASEQKPKLTYLKAPQALTTDQKYHVVGTYDGQNMRLYVDGKLVAISAAQAGAVFFEQKSWLAAGIYKDDDDHFPFKGVISRAAVFRGALPAEDVSQRFVESE